MLGQLEEVFESLRADAQKMHLARESGLQSCRQIIQLSSKSIRQVHKRNFTEASALLNEASKAAANTRTTLRDTPELYYAGYLQDAEKELVEAAAVLALITNTEVPTHQELGVGIMAYLNGLGEAASEIRRFVLDEMRAGKLADSERILKQMEGIYDELTTFDYPDGMTGGLRRTCDALRAVVERTRSDLTMTSAQQELINELRLRN